MDFNIKWAIVEIIENLFVYIDNILNYNVKNDNIYTTPIITRQITFISEYDRWESF